MTIAALISIAVITTGIFIYYRNMFENKNYQPETNEERSQRYWRYFGIVLILGGTCSFIYFYLNKSPSSTANMIDGGKKDPCTVCDSYGKRIEPIGTMAEAKYVSDNCRECAVEHLTLAEGSKKLQLRSKVTQDAIKTADKYVKLAGRSKAAYNKLLSEGRRKALSVHSTLKEAGLQTYIPETLFPKIPVHEPK